MYLVKPPGIIRKLLSAKLTWHMNSRSPELFLTFDDGPIPELTSEILEILKAKNVPATFFCVGENMVKYPQIFKQIVNDGHTIGNHTFNHLNGRHTTNDHYFTNIRKFDHNYNTPYFRPPYGRIKLSQIRDLKKYHHIIFWSVLSGDFDANTSPYKCYANVARNFHNGAIIVFHDNDKARKSVLFALPRIIDQAREQGYIFKAL